VYLLRRLVTAALVAVIHATLALTNANAVTIEWVTVGNPGNANDTINTGTNPNYGAVNYEYRIGKHEVTIQQYTEFLNAAAKSDPYFLYYGDMGTQSMIAGISRSGPSGSYTYSVIGPSGTNPAGASSPGNRPITYVSWFNAARFANWMHNGQGSGSTETGAYTLSGAISGTAPARNPGAQYYIPTENEWYKAAYYSPVLNSGAGGYYTYATQSYTPPGNTIGSGVNQANNFAGGYAVTRSASFSSGQNYLTNVGAFTNSASYYGTFDQNGNVHEWNDLAGAAGSARGIRGGSWTSGAYDLSASVRATIDPSNGGNFGSGFRLASPDPSTGTLFDVASGTQTQGAAGYPLLTPVNATSVTKTGLGALVLDAANTYTGRTRVNQGALFVTNPAALQATPITVQPGAMLSINTPGTMQAPSLTLTGSSQLILPTATHQVVSLGSLSVDQVAGGRIDIGKGRIEIAPGGISEADLRAALIVGRGNGTFSVANSGIVTSAANPSPLMVPVIGYNVLPSGATVVAWSAFGDMNLDGSVDFDDVLQFVSASRYDTGLPASWGEGDFDYNGVVDFDDVLAFTSSRLYDKGSYLPPPLAPSGMAASGIAAVPEPSTWVMGIAGLAALAAWRRRAANVASKPAI
jgi:sulfatase modifying factor 1